MSKKYNVHPDIALAETLPASFYRDHQVYEQMRENIFARSWHWIGDAPSLLPLDGYAHPLSLMDGYLEEPMMLVSDRSGQVRCLSNVCTHRANLVVHNPGKVNNLTCMYHGRRWDMDGSFKFMPEFKEAKNFPRPCDHLHRFPLEQWGPWLFTGLDPEINFDIIRSYLDQWVGFLPLNEFKLESNKNRDYLINCHWSLYCDNYLEGFHIPFVHPDLNAVLDYDAYTTELFDYGTLQIGFADGAEEVFDLPEDHPVAGQSVAAFYFWLFPNIMLNFYPWGLSVNIVKPLSIKKTKVSFITYMYDESKYETYSVDAIDKTEREDEFVVEGVFKGLQSRFYQAGRFSPKREQGVHHFHRMLADRV